ncbi:hypothetical protein [Paenibacillus macerans]|uniref:hypothetical protein n=1 Tax=Paenibacillus macerans TaxID=44252 RepID=UPI00203CAD14|nr:hypothetical protein [Paenibacillus macerans]MCM3703617.1 hypothetical protein [Paenibacillus macerans]
MTRLKGLLVPGCGEQRLVLDRPRLGVLQPGRKRLTISPPGFSACRSSTARTA